MAAYGTDPERYLPPHTSQLAKKLSADGVDDCLVCSTLALVNGASLGEATRTPQGHEPSTAALVRTARRMRKKLDDPATATREQQRGPKASGANDTDMTLSVRKRSECPSVGATVFLFGFSNRRAVS